MKVAVCSTGNSLDSPVDSRLGKCPFFVVVDTETFDADSYENPGVGSVQGSGIMAAQFLSSLKVSAVISGNLGPNVERVLSAAGIKVYGCIGDTIRYAINYFNAGSLKEISSPASADVFVPGHGLGQAMDETKGFSRGKRKRIGNKRF